MKNLTILALALMTTSAFAATKIECTGTNGDKVRLEKFHDDKDPVYNNKGWFNIWVSESLSTGYLGEIEERIVMPEKKQAADMLSDWDGNSGVSVSMRKGFLNEKAGATTQAFLKVIYNDIATDSISHTLTCTVLE